MKPALPIAFIALVVVFGCSALLAAPPDASPLVPLHPKGTVRVPRRTYDLPDTHEDGSGAALVVQADDVTIDFRGATLRGTSEPAEPDTRHGTALLLIGRNITVKNLHAHGYKVGILARNCSGLKIVDCDLSYNWKQHLRSTPEREDLADWMSFHQNEKNEWLRYGAGIYLEKCDKFTVKGCTVTGGQCGLMMTQSVGGEVAENNFSFLSGVGVGLYRTSKCHVARNKIDWCVRGYSHGVYNRGQDSAGILVYEQSNDNIFQYNSATHGGDGFFLWAGQTTMDTGEGGCNNNYIIGNDFSHAPTNGIEATFSSNHFGGNLVMECWHGVWGGYSFKSEFYDNIFAYNAVGIAIEHGRDNEIHNNYFYGDNDAISLWRNKTQDPDWAYPKKHDTTSQNYELRFNTFTNIHQVALRLRDTTNVRDLGNVYKNCREIVQVAEGTPRPTINQLDTVPPTVEPPTLPTMEPSGAPLLATETDPAAYQARFEKMRVAWNKRMGIYDNRFFAKTYLKPGALRGRRYIIVDEWGPYDFRSPRLVPREIVAGNPHQQHFEILGPAGKWRVLRTSSGVQLSAQSGVVPGDVQVTMPNTNAGAATNVILELEYVGEATTDYRGITTPAGKPIAFRWEKFVLPIAWDVRWYRWDDATDPRTHPAAFDQMIRNTKPLLTDTPTALNYAGYTFAKGLPNTNFATVANGTFTLQTPGRYTLEVTTDDGCRVWVDDKPVITDAWHYQGPTLYTTPLDLSAGKHSIRVEHFQIDGYAALQLNLKPLR